MANPPAIFSTIRHCPTDKIKNFSQNVSQQNWEKNIEIFRQKVKHVLLFFSTSNINLEFLPGEQVSNILTPLLTKQSGQLLQTFAL